MERKILFFFSAAILTLTTGVSLALDNYQPGFIVMENGDTLRGLINDKQWIDNPTEIEFKKVENDRPLLFASHQIRAFYLEETGEYYKSGSVRFTIRKSASSDVPIGATKHFSGFFTVLITGEINLYTFNYANTSYYFIGTVDEKLTELVLKNTQSGNLKLYIGTLKAATIACAQSQKDVEKVIFSEKSISSFVSRYNACVSNGNSYERPKEKKFEYAAGVSVGVSKSVLEFKGNEIYEPQVGSGTLEQIAPILGGYFTVILKRGQKRWSGTFEMLYKPWQEQTEASYNQGVFDYTTINSFDIDYLKFGFSVRHTFPARRVRVFTQLGLSRSMFLTPTVKSEWERESTAFPESGTTMYIGTGEIGRFIGIGLNYSKLEAELRYEINSGFGTNTLVATSGNYFAFIVKYQIILQ